MKRKAQGNAILFQFGKDFLQREEALPEGGTNWRSDKLCRAPRSMLFLSMQTQYGRNRQYRREHNSHAHRSPRMTVVSLLDAAFPNKITGAFIAAVTEDLQTPREARLWKAQAVDVVDR